MSAEGKAKRVRIYVSEDTRSAHQPAFEAVLRFLQREHAAGATVFRAVEGFGSGGQIHTFRLADVAQDLPVVVEWIDTPDRVERLMPRVTEMVAPGGLITVEDTAIVLHNLHPVRRLSKRVTAGDFMSQHVASVGPGAGVRSVVEQLVGRSYRAVPVVDAGIPVGIITNSDLISRGELSVRLELLKALDDTELAAELDRISRADKTASDIMTPSPVTAGLHAPITEVAATMVHRRLKRLPVVDEKGLLVGMISRFDVLRSVTEAFPTEETSAPDTGLNVSTPVSLVMRREVPRVLPSAPVYEVMQAVMSTRLNRVLVVDEQERVVGIISDAELLERVTPSVRPSAIGSLMRRLPFVHGQPGKLATERHSLARRASDLMSTDFASVPDAAPLGEVIGQILSGGQKLVAVVDKEQRLVGALDRSDLLAGLHSFGSKEGMANSVLIEKTE